MSDSSIYICDFMADLVRDGAASSDGRALRSRQGRWLDEEQVSRRGPGCRSLMSSLACGVFSRQEARERPGLFGWLAMDCERSRLSACPARRYASRHAVEGAAKMNRLGPSGHGKQARCEAHIPT